MDRLQILVGDCREVLRGLPGESVHCCITSPPYWGLRDYGIPPVVWGGEEACGHDWGSESYVRRSSDGGSADRKQETNMGAIGRDEPVHHASCRLCGAWKGSLGLEPTPELYVDHIVEVFREVKRVLRKDGTLWLNMGDGYASGELGRHDKLSGGGVVGPSEKWSGQRNQNRLETGLKPKDLIGMPWRVAFALQADGWWLRSDCIWSKPNPMPESVTDRPTRSHEYLFLLTKAARYYYDADAIREKAIVGFNDWFGGSIYDGVGDSHKQPQSTRGIRLAGIHPETGRNRRSVWEIATQAYPDAHFATYPEKLVEPCILAGSSERGCCPKCSAPWQRVTEKTPDNSGYPGGPGGHKRYFSEILGRGEKSTLSDVARYSTKTIAWEPTCECDPEIEAWKRACGADKSGGYKGKATKDYKSAGVQDPSALKARILEGMGKKKTVGWSGTCECGLEPVPCTVLDPFGGSGTTGLVALRLGRRAILIEIKEEYAEMARQRCKALADQGVLMGGAEE